MQITLGDIYIVLGYWLMFIFTVKFNLKLKIEWISGFSTREST